MSNIDPTKPVTGEPQTAETRQNFQHAADEIDATTADAIQALADAAAAQGDATQALTDAAAAQGDATQALADAATAQSTADSKIGSVNEDPAPVLGGDLTSKGNVIRLTRADDALQGGVGAADSVPGAYLLAGEPAAFDDTVGGVLVDLARTSLYGSAVRIVRMAHTVAGGRQVYVSEDGNLFGVDPPPTSWSEADSDAGIYAIAPLAVWVRMTGLEITVPQDEPLGTQIQVSASVVIENLGNADCSVDIAFGINGAQPTAAPRNVLIPAQSPEQSIDISLSTTTTALTAGDLIQIWLRRATQQNANADPSANGTTTLHELVVSVPSSGSPATPGDVVQGTGTFTTGIVATWQGGKVLGSTGVDIADLAPPMTLKGDLWGYDGAASVRMPVGTTGSIILADSTHASGRRDYRTIPGAIGWAGTARVIDADVETNETPAPSAGHWIRITTATTAALTVDAMTEVGGTTWSVDEAVTLDLAAYDVIGTPPSAKRGILEFRNIAGELTAVWANGA